MGRWPVRCEDVTDQLSALAAEESTLDTSAADHLASCLRCSAEVAQYRKLLRNLRSLRVDSVYPPASLCDDILSSYHDADVRLSRGLPRVRRAVYVGGIAAATAGAAAGAIVLASLSRRGRLAS